MDTAKAAEIQKLGISFASLFSLSLPLSSCLLVLIPHMLQLPKNIKQFLIRPLVASLTDLIGNGTVQCAQTSCNCS